MAKLIDSVEADLHTDFALLSATQVGAERDAETWTYAASSPGHVALLCGTKFADIKIRLERWDDVPTAASDDWEDCDELPWLALDGPAHVRAEAFDGDSDYLDLTGVEQGRVQVLAQGRHRYTYSQSPDDLPPEQWLLRFWPEHKTRDAMSGPPRRLAAPLKVPLRDGWKDALKSWERRGWSFGTQIYALEHIVRALRRMGMPFTEDILAEQLRAFHPDLARSNDLWSEPAFRDADASKLPKHAHAEEALANVHATRQRFATAAGMAAVGTYREAFEWLLRVGLISRLDPQAGGHFVLNPLPRPAWDVLGHDENQSTRLLALSWGDDFAHVTNDIQHLLRWAPDQLLVASPSRIASRLALPLPDVLDTLEFRALRGELRNSARHRRRAGST